MLVAPSILSADFSDLKNEIQTINQAEWVHIDVMDGHFVPNLTIGPLVVKAIRAHSSQIFDTHLMISNPEDYIEAFIKAGSDQVTFHVEAVKDVLKVIDSIKTLGAKAGISLKPSTDIALIEPYLKDLDLVLVMSVEPGFGGQKFMPESLDKMRALAKYKDKHNLSFDIVVDGGINETTARLCEEAGATVLVAGSYVFGSSDRNAQIEKVRG